MKKINLFNFILFALIIVADIGFIVDGGLTVKTIASMLFVAVGFLNLFYFPV